MGYYTNYSLEWSVVKPVKKPCLHCNGTGLLLANDAVQEFIDSVPFLFGNSETMSSVLDDSCKWYEHEDDMKRLSKEFPGVLFTLHGSGEESSDVWVKYFKDGKMQVSKAEIKLAKFDPRQLV